MSARLILRMLLTAVFALVTPLVVQAQENSGEDTLEPSLPNTVCGPDISSGRFKLSQIGPKVAGIWTATAPGLGFTVGVQTFPVLISFERGRLYLSGGGGPKVELKPVYGRRKALRYDPILQRPLPDDALATKLPMGDIANVTGCEPRIAAQFTWSHGVGTRSSGESTASSPITLR